MPSSADLLDANVWLALAAEDHTHHARAKAYWQDEATPQIAFCRVTQLAFLRHLKCAAIRLVTFDRGFSIFPGLDLLVLSFR